MKIAPVAPLDLLLVAQVLGLAALAVRLGRWRGRPPGLDASVADAPVTASEGSDRGGGSGNLDPAAASEGRVTIVVPTFNEAKRIGPLLEALPTQDAVVREILVVDSGSTDGTRALVERAARGDTRIRLVTDPPKPADWVGKAWALEHARTLASAPWMLGLDADTIPRPGLASAAMRAVDHYALDAASFAPRFAGQGALERFLQPALLVTLIYRVSPGAVGTDASDDAVLANGQCFVVRRDVLARAGGFAPVRASFAEDVSLARHLARSGARVGFLDGARLYDVRSYTSAREMWREWGRSIDLKDATPRWRQGVDIALLALVQGLPIPLLLLAATVLPLAAPHIALNVVCVGIRAAMSVALRHNYERRGLPYWLSPLADPVAVTRVILSTLRRPTTWRGRAYE